jgi:uncharacterized protein (DUF433 family)
MSTTTDSEPTYQHPEYRPGSNYREMWLKGRRIRASVVHGWIHGPDPMTPEEFARDFKVPLEAVHDALAYVDRNRDFIAQERDREAANIRARGHDRRERP